MRAWLVALLILTLAVVIVAGPARLSLTVLRASADAPTPVIPATLSQTVFRDPADRFTVPIPINWTTKTRAEKGVSAAWTVVDPSFKL